MKYYFKPENRIIETEELKLNYGSMGPIAALGMYELSVQPDYVPVSFEPNGDGTYYPVESYESMREKAVEALIASGMTRAEAEAAIA